MCDLFVSTYLEPLETSSRLRSTTFVAQLKIVKVAFPVRSIWCDPLQNQKEERCDREGFIDCSNWLDVHVVHDECERQEVEQCVSDWEVDDSQDLPLFLWRGVAMEMPPTEKPTRDDSHQQARSRDIDHKLMEVYAALSKKRIPNLSRTRSGALDVVCAGEANGPSYKVCWMYHRRHGNRSIRSKVQYSSRSIEEKDGRDCNASYALIWKGERLCEV